MKMREKIIVILLVVSMILSMFAGCATTNPIVDSTGTSENTAINETEETSEPTVAPTETEATEAATEAPTEPPTEPTEPEPEITVVQQNSINMLNYLAFIAEEILLISCGRSTILLRKKSRLSRISWSLSEPIVSEQPLANFTRPAFINSTTES